MSRTFTRPEFGGKEKGIPNVKLTIKVGKKKVNVERDGAAHPGLMD